MFLPPKALALIKEYSKPLTRSDWRNIRRLNMGHLYNNIMDNKNKYYPPVFKLFIRNIVRNYSYQYIIQAIKMEGKEKASIMLNIPIEVLNTLKIIREL